MQSRGLTDSRSLSKIKFRKLNKLRSSHSLLHLDLQQSTLNASSYILRSHLQTSKVIQVSPLQTVDSSRLREAQQALKKTLNDANFKHHDQKECMCGNCTCGRHLCTFSIVRPQMTMQNTSYDRQFGAKEAFKSLVLKPQEIPLFKTGSMIFKSSYNKEFPQKTTIKPQTQRYKDTLKQEGPIQLLTSYSNQFRPQKGCNQYVKPTNRTKIDPFPLNANTTYSKEFGPKKLVRSQSLKTPDSLKNSKGWLGQSVYTMKFKNPNPEDYPHINPLMAKSEKVLKNPDFLSRFKTSYKNDFYQKETAQCPVKKQLSSNNKYHQLRALMNEKGDFRAMNPTFRPFSTSKLFCA